MLAALGTPPLGSVLAAEGHDHVTRELTNAEQSV
jgi:hypothetical protein